jgi:hypothetical protein
MRQLGQVGGSNSSKDCFSLSTTIVAVPCASSAIDTAVQARNQTKQPRPGLDFRLDLAGLSRSRSDCGTGVPAAVRAIICRFSEIAIDISVKRN